MIRHILKLVWARKGSNALIGAEIFMSFLVVFGVVTMALYLIDNYNEPLGFEYENVWNVSVNVGQASDDFWSEEMVTRFRNILRELQAMPEVTIAAGAQYPPYSLGDTNGNWMRDGREIDLYFNEVTDEFKDVMGVQLVAGRWFGREDDAATFVPVVLDRDAARAFFGSANAVGEKLTSEGGVDTRVIGIVSEFRKNGELSGKTNYVFRRVRLGDAKSRPPRNIVFKLKPGTSADIEERIITRMQALAPNWSFEIQPLARMRDFSLRLRLTPVIIASTIGLFLILMVALGLSGVLWQSVTRRTREIGLRRALGETSDGIHRQIVFEVAMIASLAVVLGMVVAIQLPLSGILEFVGWPLIVSSILLSSIIIYAVTTLSALYPSILASRIHPSDALRYE